MVLKPRIDPLIDTLEAVRNAGRKAFQPSIDAAQMTFQIIFACILVLYLVDASM